jgi:hypothetical protein
MIESFSLKKVVGRVKLAAGEGKVTCPETLVKMINI